MSGRSLRLLSVLLVIVVGSIVVWKSTANELERFEVSEDGIGAGIIERWNQGIPIGYAAEEADDLERGGYLYARLAYQEDLEALLRDNWEDLTEGEFAAFTELVQAQLALPDLPDDHRTLLEAAPAQPEADWTGCLMDAESGGRIVLLYDPETRVMYLAEYHPADGQEPG